MYAVTSHRTCIPRPGSCSSAPHDGLAFVLIGSRASTLLWLLIASWECQVSNVLVLILKSSLQDDWEKVRYRSLSDRMGDFKWLRKEKEK